MAENKELEAQDKLQQSTSPGLNVLMQQIASTADMPNLTQAQIDEVLDQKRQVNEYVRQDNKDRHDRFKTNSGTFRLMWVTGLVGFLIIFVLVIFFRPNLLDYLITALLAGGGGFGLGRSSRKDE